MRWPRHDQGLLQAKSVAAVVTAWMLASWLLPPSVTTFAPFTALLALQSTVYRSVWHSLQYAAAVAAGVLPATALSAATGVQAWSLAVVMTAAFAAARLPVYGPLRLQVPVTALFAFTAGGGVVGYSLHLVAAVALGIGCGLTVSLLLAPPAYYRSAEEAVLQLSASVAELLTDIAGTLRDSAPDRARSDAWARRASNLEATARRARETVDEGETSARLNPRRLWRPDRPAALPRQRRVVNTLQRVALQTQSIQRGLAYAADSDYYDELARDFLSPYAGLLEAAAGGVEAFGGLDGDAFDHHLNAGHRHYMALTTGSRLEHLNAPNEWPLYGGLLTDAYRILEELQEAARHD
ncbi:hypothetical protein G5C51_36905 [Streptomyces sp. A7024]|uniref:FUSC family protein n=1 Tax=Streptomyces coryli TaxID=1128680 RepID=A0A6G4UB41_9ACTN|nr:hypothetical protein [Streptomyces coryli]NGN69455.1 hypothetical protein [Streptomyces coryli]